jgi:AraC-like DNA-binding protein
MPVTRQPAPQLRPFVKVLWASDGRASPRGREYVSPTGGMHLVFRLAGPALRVYRSAQDEIGQTIGHAIVGGARSGFYTKEAAPSVSVGALLEPGAAEALFGASAAEFAERHTALVDVWGRAARALNERLAEARGSDAQLALLEACLAARLPPVRALHPAVAQALGRLAAGERAGAVARACGYSHRHFVVLFKRAVGLGPKVYARVLRFRRALHLAARADRPSWPDIALAAGYSDQAHFVREFRSFTGVTPERYRRLAPAHAHHVIVPR